MHDKQACLLLCHLHVMKHVVDQLFNVFLHHSSVPRSLNQCMNKVKDAEHKAFKPKNLTCSQQSYKLHAENNTYIILSHLKTRKIKLLVYYYSLH